MTARRFIGLMSVQRMRRLRVGLLLVGVSAIATFAHAGLIIPTGTGPYTTTLTVNVPIDAPLDLEPLFLHLTFDGWDFGENLELFAYNEIGGIAFPHLLFKDVGGIYVPFPNLSFPNTELDPIILPLVFFDYIDAQNGFLLQLWLTQGEATLTGITVSGTSGGQPFRTEVPIGASVPEPASIALLTVGLAGVGVRRWKRLMRA